MNKINLLIESDVIKNHLIGDSEVLSVLELALQKGVAYTSVLNSAEIISEAKNEDEKKIIIDVLSAIHVLGLPARYSLNVDEFSDKFSSARDLLFLATAKASKLKILTFDTEKYKDCDVEVISTEDLEKL